MLTFTFAWTSIKPPPTILSENSTHFYSIIIPIRNEAHNISATLTSVLNNDFDKAKFEIIVVNDHSTDLSATVVKSFVEQYSNVRLINLNESVQGKKQAITLAIAEAKGDMILCTDGDCEVPKHWIESYKNAYENDKKLKLVFGAVTYKAQNCFEKLLQLELIGLVGIGASTASLGYPTMVNGANFSYKKEVFEEVNGYEGNIQIPSGDDEFLLRRISSKYPDGISFLRKEQAIVKTSPPSNFKELINQRKRWAGKWRKHEDWFSWMMPVFIFVLNAGVIYGIYQFLFQFKIILFALALKPIVDFIFIKKMSDFYNTKLNLITFLALEISYPFYVIFFGITSNFGKYIWKERQF